MECEESKKTGGQELLTDYFSICTTWRKEKRREEERMKGKERRKHQDAEETNDKGEKKNSF